MANTTNANQISILSASQLQNLSIDESQLSDSDAIINQQFFNNINSSIDISFIILQVLRQYNDASLGNTDISGDLLSNNIDSERINTNILSIDNELIF